MAHMIDETTGAPAIAYAGETPWHKLGRKMGDNERRDIAAAMTLAGLNWAVERIGLKYFDEVNRMPTNNEPTRRSVPDAYGIVRMDTGAYLGTVGPNYTPIQNADGFDVLEPLVANHGCTVEVMASLDGGRRTFALVRMPDATVTPVPGDDVRGYVLVLNAHDGSGSHLAALTPIRVVCQNTLSMALGGRYAAVSRIKHTKSAPDRLKQAAEIVDRMQHALKESGDTYRTLAERQMTPKELAAYIETVIPTTKEQQAAGDVPDVIRKRREAIADLIFNGHHTQDGGADARYGYASAWRAYNAVTEYFDHVRPREAKSLDARTSAYDSALFGGNAAIKANALRQLVTA